ncbi:hypothetical protein IV38_GL000169 [Lactobacillus selangorensis]|uniref:Phosphotyrosine protein phosphatase I domain-containing protein n=2 Tax=Lactobacillus selangorensis TaxID=81857 RepID=A0A0R2G0Y9_9LACO|nr:hypothetical protein IV38_GL000169 [Lactobacillus selangorensis]KRN34184.1 hypothetical protein IV40_GL000500 [Lactobacillus selangorensis]
MAEDGIDISKQFAKPIDPHVLKTADLVVTLCGDARDHCPVTPPTVQKLHWPLPDPAHATGTPDQQLAVFRQVRDQIKHNILDLKHVR